MIACLGETTGESALITQFHIMRGCEEGLQILDDRPRINTSTIDFGKLKSMPKDSFGYTYWKFLDDNVSGMTNPENISNISILFLAESNPRQSRAGALPGGSRLGLRDDPVP